MSRRLLIVLVGLTLGGSFYLLLIDTATVPELLVLGGSALLAAVAFTVGYAHGGATATTAPGWWLRSWRVLAGTPRQIGIVSAHALRISRRRRRRGELRAVPFRGGDAPEDLGRYALTESLGSFAPNTIVIGVDRERGLLLVHQLRREGDGDALDVLDLG